LGVSLIYSGSFAASVERDPHGQDRVQLGMNPLHLSWPIPAGKTFTTPEAVAVHSDQGLGGMSRSFHRLYRDHLSKSSWTKKDRPVLMNHWEGAYFDYDEKKIYAFAERASELGMSLVRYISTSSTSADIDLIVCA
jgi:alpha-galactosidase